MPYFADKTLQDAQTTGNGTEVDAGGNAIEHIFYIIGSAGVSAGAVQIETAHTKGYAGTWAAIGTPTTIVASSVLAVRVSGVYRALRARISTNVTGGTVTVKLSSGS